MPDLRKPPDLSTGGNAESIRSGPGLLCKQVESAPHAQPRDSRAWACAQPHLSCSPTWRDRQIVYYANTYYRQNRNRGMPDGFLCSTSASWS